MEVPLGRRAKETTFAGETLGLTRPPWACMWMLGRWGLILAPLPSQKAPSDASHQPGGSWRRLEASGHQFLYFQVRCPVKSSSTYNCAPRRRGDDRYAVASCRQNRVEPGLSG
jgi:hypothetical protein